MNDVSEIVCVRVSSVTNSDQCHELRSMSRTQIFVLNSYAHRRLYETVCQRLCVSESLASRTQIIVTNSDMCHELRYVPEIVCVRDLRHTHVYKHTHIHTQMHTQKHTRTHNTHMFTLEHVLTNTYQSLTTHTHTHTHTYTYTHTHTKNTHIHTTHTCSHQNTF